MTGGGAYQMAITPDGKTLYVISWSKPGQAPSYVIPIATATNTPGKPIKIQGGDVGEIVMNPDGRTAYAIGQSTTGTEIVPHHDRHEHPRRTGSRRPGRGRPGHHARWADPLPRPTR